MASFWTFWSILSSFRSISGANLGRSLSSGLFVRGRGAGVASLDWMRPLCAGLARAGESGVFWGSVFSCKFLAFRGEILGEFVFVASGSMGGGVGLAFSSLACGAGVGF